jgi:hypothetical protein
MCTCSIPTFLLLPHAIHAVHCRCVQHELLETKGYKFNCAKTVTVSTTLYVSLYSTNWNLWQKPIVGLQQTNHLTDSQNQHFVRSYILYATKKTNREHFCDLTLFPLHSVSTCLRYFQFDIQSKRLIHQKINWMFNSESLRLNLNVIHVRSKSKTLILLCTFTYMACNYT